MISLKVIEQIKKAEKILLLTHENPDGDALGSLLAFKEALESLGKKVVACCPDRLPAVFSFLPNSIRITEDFLLGDHDLIFILDCGDLKRTGFATRLKEFSRVKRKVINIDHHPKNDIHRIARFNLVDFTASSTAELIFRILKQLKIKFNINIATCLLCGLYTDTGCFQHSNTSPGVLKIAAELMRYGGQLKKITRNITNAKSIAGLKLWGIVLTRIQTNKRYGLVISYVTKGDIESCGANDADLLGVVNVINSVPGARAAILFSEREEGRVKASLRTERNDVDLSHFAQLFGGGGLKKASGFCLDGKIVVEKNGRWSIKLI